MNLVVGPGLGLELRVCKTELLDLFLSLLLLGLKGIACLKHTLQGLLNLQDPRLVLAPSHLFGN